MGCDNYKFNTEVSECVFQSTHPHGVRRSPLYAYSISPHVSIHAPTWGATYASLAGEPVFYVSIHAPTWGATNPSQATRRLTGFNPRTHMGCDGMQWGMLLIN